MTRLNARRSAWIHIAGFSSIAFLFAALTISVLTPPKVLAAPGVVAVADWNQWRGPNRNGSSNENAWADKIPQTGPAKLWSAQLNTGFSSVSTLKNQVFSMGWRDGNDVVYCLDGETGKTVWEYKYPCPKWDRQHEGGPACTPSVDDSVVITISREAKIVALETATGKLLWSKELGKEFGVQPPNWGFSGSPLIMGDRVIVDVGVIAAFEKKTGNVIWKTKNYGSAYSSPVSFTLGGKPVLAVWPRVGLVILNDKDGAELCQYPFVEKQCGVNAATPLIIGTQVFVAAGYNLGGAMIDVANEQPKMVWQTKEMRNHMASCVVYKDAIFGFDDGTLTCLDVATGQTLWRERGLGKGAVMLAGDNLVIASERGELLVAPAAREAFKPKARWMATGGKVWTAPVLSHGKIYCRNAEGLLVCFDVRN